ncbi:hypothetical protein [Pontibacillus marinus]|uniref:Lipoprotein n=1 Tax=Pontibacillus marinus BH030004 = DSM 16465 TaxID=1385511 RepID=A0A0A5I5E4_9BACI|nr:hypothetical protein [Pontibacillus marinus]KGX91032.1 hypothetical protein N783_13420 [Pontibacillus marinus BH030004 = DSM 16465]
MKSIKLLLVALGAMLVLGACSNNESQDIEELDVSQESEKDQSNKKESAEEKGNQTSSSGSGGSDSGGSGSPEESTNSSEEKDQQSSSSESEGKTKSGGGSSADKNENNTSDQKQDDKQTNDSGNTTGQSSNNTASSEESHKLSELKGTAVEVIKGVYAVSVPKDQLKNVSKETKLTFKAGDKTYELKYEKDINAFANLYIDDNDLKTLKKGIVITG